MTYILNFLKKKLHKKIVIATSIPHSKAGFLQAFERGDSDFINSLSKLFHTTDKEKIWGKYAALSKRIDGALKRYKSYGAVIEDELTADRLHAITDADVVIFIIHHSDVTDELELSDGMISSRQFITALPPDFRGIIDLSSCFSSSIQLSVKMQCPYSKVIAIKTKTSIDLRLAVYSHIINLMRHKKELNYIDALKQTLDTLQTIKNRNESPGAEIVYLGGETVSSVFAPKEAPRGNSFIIQIALHKTSEYGTVELYAKEADEGTSLRNPARLKLKLKRNDKIDFMLSVETPNPDDFRVKQKRKTVIWANDLVFVYFAVEVSEHCRSTACIANIKVSVNKSVAGNILFKTLITDHISEKPATVYIRQHDKAKEMCKAKSSLIHSLEREKSLLEQAIQQEAFPDKRKNLERDLAICINSLRLLDEKKDSENPVLKVFISSTSDLSPYRQIVKEQVEHCSMFPEMYENWPQKDKYPRDYCCEKVLSSDIFVCILGPKYGFIEPLMDLSMTEIEYRVATQAGKPVLVYIIQGYEQMLKTLPPEQAEASDRQRKFIKEMEINRMVDYFEDEMSLALSSRSDLRTFQLKN